MPDDDLGKIDQSVLKDGEWHPFSEIANETGMSRETILRVLRFLSEFGFADIDDEGKRVKLNPNFLELP